MLDNYDLNVYTPSGSSETHALVIEVMQNSEIRYPGDTPREEVVGIKVKEKP